MISIPVATRLLLAGCLAVATLTGQADDSAPVQRLPLADPALAATEQGRQDLKYLARCALLLGTAVVATVDGTEYEFPGGVGLAPHWAQRGLSAPEARWVSACMYALANGLGAHVHVSLRTPFRHPAPGLVVPADELAEYSLHEGTYFGDVFAARPAAYVCGPRHNEEVRRRLLAHKRVCALPPQADSATPASTACGFTYVGECTPAAFVQQGVRYMQAISVYLPPHPAAAAPAPLR